MQQIIHYFQSKDVFSGCVKQGLGTEMTLPMFCYRVIPNTEKVCIYLEPLCVLIAA